MKITVTFLLLLLLVGSVCTEEHDINAVLRQLTASLAQQRVELRFLQSHSKAKLNELERQKSEIHKLKQQLQVKRVAFSASLLAHGYGYVGPFNRQTTLKFKHVITNVGNAYNPHTGVFTPPVKGAYHFEWYIGSPGDRPVGAVLVKNSEQIFLAYVHDKAHYAPSSNGATLLLDVGDVVFLRLWPNARVFDSAVHHTTFSGHLLFTM